MQIAVTECNSASTNLEKSSQLLIDAKAGLQHLKEMLEDLPKKGPPVPLSDDTLVEVIVQCGDCMERAQKVMEPSITQSDKSNSYFGHKMA